MKQITIEINAPDTLDTTNQELKILLKDALHDFIRVRTPNIQYVESRYPHYTTEQKRSKRLDVTNRCGIATYLQTSSIKVILEDK